MGEAQRDAFGLCGAVIAGKYRVLEVVGEGGFGVVYRGHHVDFDEPVAIKCLKLPAHLPDDAQDALVEKLRDEGKLLLRLSRRSTGIVQALDVGSHTSNTGGRIPYLVLEWLQGRTLAQELRSRRSSATATSLAEALELLRPVAAALAIAHAEGVAHRDIKPDNLMLVPPRGDAKVLDFGIAKVFEEATSAADAKTSAAVPVFTPGYGAPEQFEKRRGATGPWTDVFSLALVFVEMVSGRQAITGEELIDLYKKTTDPVQRPTLRSVGVEAPAEVENVLRKAVDVDPSRRYPNAAAFFDALEAAVGAGGEAVHRERAVAERDPEQLASAPTEEILGGAPPEPSVATVSAEPATGALRARTTEPQALPTAPASIRGRSRVGLAVAAALLVSAAIAMVVRLRSTSAEAPATTTEASGSPPTPSALAPPTAPELGLKTIAQYRDPPSELAGNPLTTTAWRAAAKSFEVACAHPGAAPRWCAGRDFCDAQIAFMRDQLDEAELRYQAAAVADPSWAMPHAGLAAVWTQRKNLEKALDEAAVAQQLEPDWWGAIASGARAYSALDRFDGAIGEYRRALALAPDSATLLSELALTYHAARFDTEATNTATRALALSPDLVHIRVMLAERALEAGDGAEALVQADKALAIAPRHVTSLLARADALVLLSRPGDAREAYAHMLDVARASGSAKLEPRLQLVADALEQKQLPAARGMHRTSPPPQSSGPSQNQTEPRSERSKPAPTCRCAASDPLCSCL